MSNRVALVGKRLLFYFSISFFTSPIPFIIVSVLDRFNFSEQYSISCFSCFVNLMLSFSVLETSCNGGLPVLGDKLSSPFYLCPYINHYKLCTHISQPLNAKKQRQYKIILSLSNKSSYQAFHLLSAYYLQYHTQSRMTCQNKKLLRI